MEKSKILALIIGFVVVLIIVTLIIVTIVISTQASPASLWNRAPKMNFVRDLTGAKVGTADGNVIYLGEYTAQDACEDACEVKPDCRAYTWVDGAGGGYANQCFGMKTIKVRTPGNTHYSGERKEDFDIEATWNQPRDSASTFSNTLQRRLGMIAAGEGYSSQNQANNTV